MYRTFGTITSKAWKLNKGGQWLNFNLKTLFLFYIFCFTFTLSRLKFVCKLIMRNLYHNDEHIVELNYGVLDMPGEDGLSQGSQPGHRQLPSVLTHPGWRRSVHYLMIWFPRWESGRARTWSPEDDVYHCEPHHHRTVTGNWVLRNCLRLLHLLNWILLIQELWRSWRSIVIIVLWSQGSPAWAIRNPTLGYRTMRRCCSCSGLSPPLWSLFGDKGIEKKLQWAKSG